MRDRSNEFYCRHCGGRIWYRALNSGWVHKVSVSVYCDLSATTKAVPR